VFDSTVAFAAVERVWISEDVLAGGRVDPLLLAPVARLGGSLYSTVGEVYRMQRPGSPA
jgi:hypothetical protein